MAKKKASHGTPAVLVLERAGVPYRLHPYDPSEAGGERSYGGQAAAALGVPQERIFKTLLADVEGIGLAVAVVPVAGSLDLKALAVAVGGKRAQLADAAVAERTTGYIVGGISPIGQKRRLPTVVDATALTFDSIYVSAGRRGLQVELAPADLIRVTAATTGNVARLVQ